MYYTHFNLSKIELLGLQVPWIHTNEDGQLTLFFKTKNFYGNHFVRASFKNSFFEINSSESAFSLSLKEKKTVTLLIRGLKRGAGRIETIYIESTFPFNFFRTFTFFKVNCDFVVYPERRQLNLHQEVSHPMASTDAEDDFILENYIRGDSLKRIDWKKLAQSNQWYTKKFQAPKKDPIILTCESLPSEEILSSICFSLYKLHYKNIEYGLKLSEQLIISPAHSTGHLKRCLFALATHET